MEATDPASKATIYLNDPIAFDFTDVVDLESANLSTVTFSVLDANGVPYSEIVTGSFELGGRPGDPTFGRRLVFVPHFATDDAFTNGGFRAGRDYRVQLVGGSKNNGTVLLSAAGRGLEAPAAMEFSTVEGSQPGDLFRNPAFGGPHRSGFEVTTATSLDDVPLALAGGPPLLVRLSFDQALNPQSTNVPVAFDPNPLTRDIADRGRIWLEYQDPDNDPEDYTWIPAYVELERNDPNGAVVTLEPVGVLPNNAVIRVMVAQSLQDISGEDNSTAANYDPVFATFKTSEAYEQQWAAISEDFRDQRNINFGAVFPESLAAIGPGYVKAGFDFGGSTTTLDYAPVNGEVILNTSFTQVVPAEGLPFTVNGGVFRFRNVFIQDGVKVVGQGPNPMIWQCSGTFTVAGELTVSGGDGARVDVLRSAHLAKAGGVGACGGGNGGMGTPEGSRRDLRGGPGNGPGQATGTGGRGGYLSCDPACYTQPSPFYNGSGGGSGGGGGAMATQGDLDWNSMTEAMLEEIVPNVPPTANSRFQQVYGYGAAGCSGGTGSRTFYLTGGEPGDLVFSDMRQDNNFWGSAIDLNRRLRITGELTAPTGGGGGGGGGDTCSPDGEPYDMDFSGGGGGAGGGVLIVQALDTIRVTKSGSIRADGGHGGGGEQAGNCGNAGGGGGGAGGMIVLMSARSIEIEAHGNVAQNRYLFAEPSNAQFGGRDYDFAISADGGIGKVGNFGTGTDVDGKYPEHGEPMWNAVRYDSNPSGGVGGMGIVQLMAPPGDNAVDGTNTRLDDNIHFFLPNTSTPVSGLQKQQLLGWRGFPDDSGTWRDDAGDEVEAGDGDIRPAPVLLPSTLQARSRVRSKWIDTGASERRPLTTIDGQPRGLFIGDGAEVGPLFGFEGTDTSGFVNLRKVNNENVAASYRTVVDPVAIASIAADASYLGQPAYRVDLASPALPAERRYVNYQAELLNAAGAELEGYEILHHDASTLWLSQGSGPVPTAAVDLRVRAKFYEIRTQGNEGFGATYQGIPLNGSPNPIPQSSVRIGFAFHRDVGSTELTDRYPSTETEEFVYDLNSPDLQAWLAEGAPRFVMWDVTFDLQYKPSGVVPPFLSARSPRPELHFLRIPFRF